MKIIFLGLMYSESFLPAAKKNSKCGMQMAPHTFQKTLLQSFETSEDIELNVFAIPPVGSFPINYKSLFIPDEKWKEGYRQLGGINLPVIKRFIQKVKLIRGIKKIISKNASEEIAIIAYNTFVPFLEVIKRFKKSNPDIKTCLIVTDCVPGRGDMEKYMTPKAIKTGNYIVELAKNVDSFSLLTKYLAETLEIEEKPYVITECICNDKQEYSQVNLESKNRCLYTGTLDKQFGICEMVDAFTLIPDAELWICGTGGAEEYIKQKAEKFENIKFYGFLWKDELDKIRNECDYLINPRRPTGTYTRYSFPSKTAEYMTSGKPVITYKLEGIPDEYDEYLNYLTASTSEEIAEELKRFFDMSYSALTEKAQRGREYMIKEKRADRQANRILTMIREVKTNDKSYKNLRIIQLI